MQATLLQSIILCPKSFFLSLERVRKIFFLFPLFLPGFLFFFFSIQARFFLLSRAFLLNGVSYLGLSLPCLPRRPRRRRLFSAAAALKKMRSRKAAAGLEWLGVFIDPLQRRAACRAGRTKLLLFPRRVDAAAASAPSAALRPLARPPRLAAADGMDGVVCSHSFSSSSSSSMMPVLRLTTSPSILSRH